MNVAAQVAAGLLLAVASMSARADGLDPQRIQAIADAAEQAVRDNRASYLQGDPAAALARLRSVAKDGDAEAAFVLGNMAWTAHPDESLAWHRQALEWSEGDVLARLEMALQYTRHEDCARAAVEWQAVDDAGMLKGVMPAIAAYCQFRLGKYDAVYTLLRRTSTGGHGPRNIEGVLGELWGPRPVLQRHADGLAALKAGERIDADELLAATLAMGGDDQATGLLAIIAATPADATGDLADLRCLRPAIEGDLAAYTREDDDTTPSGDTAATDAAMTAAGTRKDRWATAMRDCDLLLDGGRLPAGQSLAGWLLGRAWDLELMDIKASLATFGESLWARAQSDAGGLHALNVLAALQVRAGDADGLRRSDELGWKRYRQANFAASRLAGAALADKPDPAAAATIARAALADFPDDVNVLWLALEFGQLDPATRRRALMAQVVAEYHAPSATHPFNATGRSAQRLWKALHALQPMLAPKPLSED